MMWAFENVSFVALVSALFLSLIPVLWFSFEGLLKRQINEAHIVGVSGLSAALYLLASAIAVVGWLAGGANISKLHFATLYQHHDVSIYLTLCFDLASAVFLLTTAVIANVIVFYSRRYLHRDPGFRRFYLVLFLFLFGVTLLFCAGSFDFLFAAWEIVGISSFLLIGFYWHRPQAILNAKRAYFTYRIFDVGLLISAIFAQHVWHNPDLFYELGSGALLKPFLELPLWEKWLISGLVLLPAIGKSAQFPVSFWLPKAMEGPTPSSAIFYGSISVHAGVFLLIRTSSIWYHTEFFPVLLFIVGAMTAVTATLFGRVQASVKGQIGYASVAQVGLMFVELSFGLWSLVLIHFVGNASLRCFQLLVSSTVITQQLQIQNALAAHTLPFSYSIEKWIPERFRVMIYVFSINEGYAEAIIMKNLVLPLSRLADDVNAGMLKWSQHLWAKQNSEEVFSKDHSFRSWLWLPALSSVFLLPAKSGPYLFVVCTLSILFSMVFAIGAMSRNCSPMRVINLLFVSHCLATISLMENGVKLNGPSLLYVFGLVSSYLLVYTVYSYVLNRRTFDSKKRFAGLFAQFPVASSVGFIGVLGFIGFPIATTYFGEDILLEYAVRTGVTYVLLFCAIFILNGITLIRMHSRLFYGERDTQVDIDMDFTSTQAFALLTLFVGTNVLVFVKL